MHTQKKPMANQIKSVICLALKELLKQKYYTSKMAGVKRIHTRAQVCVRRESTSGKRERESRRAEETYFFFFPPVFRDENLNNRLSWGASRYLTAYISLFFLF